MNTFDTPFGKMAYTLTDACHVYVTCNDGDLPDITVNNVEYHANGHLYREADGSWKARSHTDIYMSRPMHQGKVSDAARRKVRDTLPNAWAEFVTDEMRLEAEQVDRKRKLLKANQVVKDAQDSLREAQKQATEADSNCKDLGIKNLPQAYPTE